MLLSDRKLRDLKPRSTKYKVHDGHGLWCTIEPTDRKRWSVRYTLRGVAREMGLGVYPYVSLLEARKLTLQVREQLQQGIDPLIELRHEEAKQVQASETFAIVASKWFGERKGQWSATHRRDVQRVLNTWNARIGSIPLTQLKKSDVRPVVDEIVQRGAHSYVRDCLMYLGIVIRYFNCYADHPAEDHSKALRAYLPEKPAEVHHLAVSPQELPALMRAISGLGGDSCARVGLLLVAHTAVRTKELRAAQWDQFDLANQEWRLPAGNMKNKKPHRVPLTPSVVRLLHELQSVTGQTAGYILPGRGGPQTMISENTLLFALYRAGYRGRMTCHGFRAIFSTVLNEGRFHADAIEVQLAHACADRVRAAYLRGEFWSERVLMMQHWSACLDEATANGA
jgi:integrase